jgi:predicted unusual protein kinase regulating ubiquinone biosynthesis (AarF/ABC1/UbiB family)
MVAERASAPRRGASTASRMAADGWESLDLLPQLLEMRPLRFAYAGGLIASILAGYKLLWLRRGSLSSEEYQQRLRAYHTRSARQIYDGVLRLQGLMIKIGQTIGSRPDTFPEEYVRVLARLQDQVPPRSWASMRPHIERQLGGPIDGVFAEFDTQPVAAASLAQVYKARLKDGRQVAVKVVYPNIERLVDTDLKLLRAVIWLETRLLYSFPLEPAFRELAANIPLEVDMLHEARSMEAIASLLSDRHEIVIPGVVWECTSERVLTMEYVDGIKVTDLDRGIREGLDIKKLSRMVVEVYVELMLKHGHFHADPHPGNLFALPGDRLAIVDFGLTKRLSPEFLTAFKKMIRCIFTHDDEGVVEAMEEAGFRLKEGGGEGFRATAEFFRSMTDPATYRNRELMDAANESWVKGLKPNPMVEMPGEIILPMRVFGLILGLGFTTGLEVDVARIVLQYATEPSTEAALATG